MPFRYLLHKQTAIALILLISITAGVFFSVLQHQFLNWDDPVHATANNNVKTLDITHVKSMFKERVNGVYIPVTTLSFAVENFFFGLNPFVFHLDNLLLHIIAVILVFFFVQQLGLSLVAAWGTALIFAIHPTRVESVAWVTERKDVLYAVFYLGALLCHLRQRRWAVLVLGALSMLAKPMALSLPLIIFLIEWYQGKRVDLKAVFTQWPLLVMVGVIGALTWVHHARVPFSDLAQAPLIWMWSSMFYIRQFIAPLVSLPIHELPRSVTILNPAYWTSLLILGALIITLWYARQNRFIIFCFGYFVFSIFFLWRFDAAKDINLVAERFMYLPALGLCMLVAVGLERLYGFFKTQEAIIRALFVVALAALVSGLGLLTYQQAQVWRDTKSLWQHQIRYAPNATAYNNLAEAYLNLPEYKNHLQEKKMFFVDLYQKAISYDATHAVYYNNLGFFYNEIGEYDKAIIAFQGALKVEPNSKDAYAGLGLSYQMQGQTAQAVGAYNQLIKEYPDDEDVYINVIGAYGTAIANHPGDKVYQEKREELLAAIEQLSNRKKYTAVDFYNLAFVYQQVGGREQAMRYYIKALHLQPNYAQALYNIASLYQDAGDVKSAMELYERLVHGHPKFALAYLNMGVIYNSMGDRDRARQYYLKAASLDADNSSVYFNLGYLSESEGDMPGAINYYEKAIDADSKNGEAYYNLGNVYAQLGQQGEAIAVYLKTVELNPKHQNAYVNLSILSFKSRDFQGAIRYLEEARKLGYSPQDEYLRTLAPYRMK